MLSTHSSDLLTGLHNNKEGRKRVMQTTKNAWFLDCFTLMTAHLKRLGNLTPGYIPKTVCKTAPLGLICNWS